MNRPAHHSRTVPTLVLLALGLAPAGEVWLDWVALPTLGVETAWVASVLDGHSRPTAVDALTGERR